MKPRNFRLGFLGLLGLVGLLWPTAGFSAQQFQGVCAVVKMEILQELALERVGFLATLEITNNEGDASITDFSAALTFENPALSTAGAPNDASGAFFVQPPELSGIASLDGAGIIRPGETAVIRWFIIPKLAAGGTDPTGLRYRVGAQLAGSLYGNPIPADTLAVIPDTIIVRPDPQLEITYFQPRDVDGDDPFTPDLVETPIPFTLGVLVKNSGYGLARSVRIASEQPRIVENKQGLLLIAQLLGARIDDAPTDGASLTVNLGDIQPGRCRKGAWDMITSLSGEFIEFKASYTHASELGGRDTSIIQDLNAYFIVREALNDQPGRDNLLDFLADTVGDPERIPDTLFESDCSTLPVNRLTDVSVEEFTGPTARLRARADFENWVYFRLDDPAQAKAPIASVVRSDGKVLNPRNYWTEVRYRRPDNAKLTYLNLFDFVALGDYEYTVTYRPAAADTEPPVTRLRFSGAVAEAGGTFYVLPETQLYFMAEDASPVGTFYRLDEAGEFLPAYPFQVLTAGAHTLEYYSRDSANNQEATQTAAIAVSDRYPEVASLATDTATLFIAGDSLSVRPTAVAVGFTGVTTATGLTAQVEVFRGVYGAATLAGVPSSPTPDTAATLAVGGENVDFYRYRLGAEAWSAEAPVSAPLALTGLSGTVQLAVQGRSQYGAYPADAEAVSAAWTVGASLGASLAGTPAHPSRSGDATLSVTGSDRYCYRVDGGFYRPEAAAGAPIVLTRLADGAHGVEVLPRASAAEACPGNVPGTAIAWTVDRQYGTRLAAGTRVRQVDLGPGGGPRVEYAWDGRDDAGAVVPPGWYSVVVEVADGLDRVTRQVRLVQVGDLLADGAPLADAGSAGQLEAQAFGRWAVWQDQRSGTWNLWARELADPAASAAAVAPAARSQERPRTDGRLAVWEERQPDGSWDIWARELGSAAAAFAVTATPAFEERRPVVEWPWVVFQRRPTADPAAPWQLRAENLATGAGEAVDPTTQAQLDPALQGGRVVWQDFRDVGYGEIYLKDLDRGQVLRLTDNPGGQYHPALFDQWVVWADNRNTQFDLYGYNLLRGVEVRLTDTAENETRPSLSGPWVVYQEDSAGLTTGNLRMLHLANRASVQLTNAGSPKDKPSLAAGQVVWTETVGGRGQVQSGSLPDLQPVFRERNLVAITAGMAAHQVDAHTLLGLWNREAGVTELTRYTALVPNPVAETVTWQGGGPVGANFALEAGSFLWVKFATVEVLDLGQGECDTLHLAAGANAFGYACFPDHYSAYQLIRELGQDRVVGLRLLDAETGSWRAVSVVDGRIVGEDFPIPGVSVLLLELSAPADPWAPGG
ncbi:MAG: FlgD immunoglobulin-like domain containing protein [Deferrisomatales bacterium]|nr:FlgD immunoglobulin-like domain containing protein [Deferrisomatales bacterium]